MTGILARVPTLASVVGHCAHDEVLLHRLKIPFEIVGETDWAPHRVTKRDLMWPASIARLIAVDYRVASATLFAAFAMRSATACGCDT